MDEVGGSLDFVEGEVVAAHDVEDDARRALDGRLEQRAVDGEAHRLHDAVFALGNAHAHVRKAAVLQDGLDVRKVEVDEGGRDDEVGNAADTLLQDFVGNAERLRHGSVAGNDVPDLFVGDDDERIDVLSQIVDALHRVVHAALALEGEGLGDDRHGEDLHVLGDLGDDGRRARARTAAHTGGNEEKVGLFDGLYELFLALLGSCTADLGVCARAQPLGEVGTDLDLGLCLAAGEDLRIGVDCNIFRAGDPGVDHAVDGIVARAAHADDLDARAPAQFRLNGHGLRLAVHIISPEEGHVVVIHKWLTSENIQKSKIRSALAGIFRRHVDEGDARTHRRFVIVGQIGCKLFANAAQSLAHVLERAADAAEPFARDVDGLTIELLARTFLEKSSDELAQPIQPRLDLFDKLLGGDLVCPAAVRYLAVLCLAL